MIGRSVSPGGARVADTTTTERQRRIREQAAKELRRLRAELAEATSDLNDEEYEDLFENVAHRVDDGLRERVRRSRAECS
jgi:hypothetical protein